MNEDHLLHVEGLRSGYGAIEVLKGVSLNVNRGEFVTLLGANGAGKTTLVKTITGLIPAKDGSIRFDGKDITNQPAHLITRLGMAMVPEGRQIFGSLSVIENLQLGATPIYDKKRNGTKNIDELLEWIFQLFPRLKERIHQDAGTLSGGEQQMLAIGRALMSDPDLLLLDEPSLGVAPKIVEQIYETLTELNRDGLSLLVIEQNVDTALSVSHRTYVINLGQIVREGESKHLIESDEIKTIYMGLEKKFIEDLGGVEHV